MYGASFASIVAEATAAEGTVVAEVVGHSGGQEKDPGTARTPVGRPPLWVEVAFRAGSGGSKGGTVMGNAAAEQGGNVFDHQSSRERGRRTTPVRAETASSRPRRPQWE